MAVMASPKGAKETGVGVVPLTSIAPLGLESNRGVPRAYAVGFILSLQSKAHLPKFHLLKSHPAM